MPSVHAIALPERTSAPTAPAPTAPAFVDARWLAKHRAEVRVVDTRPAHDFAAGHVPDSCSLPLDRLRLEDTSRPAVARLAAAAAEALARCGVAPDDHVVLVDDADGSAALGAVLCELAGCARVSVVLGSGARAWRAIGNDLDTGPCEATSLDDVAWLDTAARPETVAAFEDLVDAVVDHTARVVDARSQLEHEGIVGAPCCAARGALPGSMHLEWTAFFDMAGAPRSAGAVRAIAEHVGLDPAEPVIVTCHAGHRAAIAARMLRDAGFRQVRVSIGSWHEWAARGLHDEPSDEHASAPH